MDREEQIFEIINAAGTSRSCFIEAMECAKEGNYEEAAAKIKEGEAELKNGHLIHADLANADPAAKAELLLVHAEDMLMSAETFSIMVETIMDLYQKVNK